MDWSNLGRIHFYAQSQADADALERWDPDLEPELFASGIGHNVFELYARLRMRGFSVSIGPRIPADATLLVAFAASYRNLRFSWNASRYRNLVIRSDTPLSVETPFSVECVVVPNASNYWTERYGTRVRYVPALPQRGLVVRNEGRSKLETVALKSNPENVPVILRDDAFVRILADAGVTLVVDAPSSTDGPDQAWHDFSQVDAALCVRGSTSQDDMYRKPPTKLINAWCAGTIPIVSPEQAYLELIDEGENALVLQKLEELPSCLEMLSQNQDLTEQLFRGVAEKAAEYSPTSLLELWVRVLDSVQASDRRKLAMLRARFSIVMVMIGRKMWPDRSEEARHERKVL